jgi:tetratricopeptide (TPR) repeat protein
MELHSAPVRAFWEEIMERIKISMKLFISIISIIALFTFIPSVGFAGDDKPMAEVDHLAIATLMIYDGRFDKAIEELSQVDRSAGNFDEARYYTIRGVLDSKMEEYEKAIVNYTKAIRANQAKTFEAPRENKTTKYLFSIGKDEIEETPEPEFDGEKIKKEKLEKLHAYLAQAYYKVKDYANTAKHLDLAGERGRDRAALFALRAECYWKIKQHDDAVHALNSGLGFFPEDSTLLKQKYYYFAELGLFQAAVENAKKYMAVVDADADEYIILAQLLMEAGQTTEAAKILELARGKFPESAKIDMLLGHAYMKKEMMHTTAYLFKQGAYHDRKYLKDAVEMHRRIKDYSHAIFLNAQMDDKVEKLKQLVAIVLERGEYEKVIGVKDELGRYNLLDDDNIRYALAYSYYMAKDYDQAEFHLKKIQDNELFSKGTVIRRNIEKCRENSMGCF